MITEAELNAAIAEMQGQRNPNASTCVKLASYYAIRNELFPPGERPQPIETRQSFSAGSCSAIDYGSGTDFGRAVNGKQVADILRALDGIMTGLYVINPPLYRKILRELEDI